VKRLGEQSILELDDDDDDDDDDILLFILNLDFELLIHNSWEERKSNMKKKGAIFFFTRFFRLRRSSY